MLTYGKLSQKSGKLFKSFTGLSQAEFLALHDELLPLWNKRFEYPERKRKPGGGRKSDIPDFATELLLILYFYRHYVILDVLSVLFDLDTANIWHHIETLEERFTVLASYKLSRPKGVKKIRTIEELLETYPELKEVIGDATEQSILRPGNHTKQKKYYSGRKKSHRIKHQLLIREDKRIYAISKAYPGSIHDKTIFEKERTPDKIPKPTTTRLDNAYQKVEKEYSSHVFVLPSKANRWRSLTREEKKANKEKARKRIMVEHVIARLKVFRILSLTFRANPKRHDRIFANLAGLYNFRFDLDHTL